VSENSLDVCVFFHPTADESRITFVHCLSVIGQ